MKEHSPPQGGTIFEQVLTADDPVRVTASLAAIGGRWRPFKKRGRPSQADRVRRRLKRWESAERVAELELVRLDESSPESDRLNQAYLIEWVQYPEEWKDYPAANPDHREDGPAAHTYTRGSEALRKSLERARKNRA